MRKNATVTLPAATWKAALYAIEAFPFAACDAKERAAASDAIRDALGLRRLTRYRPDRKNQHA